MWLARAVGFGLEVLLHHEESRNDRDEDVQGKEGGLQRPLHCLVAPPRLDRDAASGGRILLVDPLPSTAGQRVRACARAQAAAGVAVAARPIIGASSSARAGVLISSSS